MLRLDGDGKGDAFAGEFTINNLAYLHAVKNERLTSINTVTFWCCQGQCQNIRLLQQGFFAWHNHELLTWLAIAGHQFEGFAGQQGTEISIAKGQFWIT